MIRTCTTAYEISGYFDGFESGTSLVETGIVPQGKPQVYNAVEQQQVKVRVTVVATPSSFSFCGCAGQALHTACNPARHNCFLRNSIEFTCSSTDCLPV
jgi:hypothetical protein